MPNDIILDAFAVVAYFQNELGGERVGELLRRSGNALPRIHVTVVNLGEALYTLQDRRSPRAAAAALSNLTTSEVEFVDVDQELALVAARLKAERHLGYLDCFAAALAQRLSATVVTGDPDFRRVEDLVAIEWLDR